jgi:dihydrofolate reductase
MRKLSSFTQLSVNGFYADANSDMSWAHQNDPNDKEWNDFVSGNAGGGGMLLFGKTTYDLMIKWWPTPQAIKTMPDVANPMNAMPKVVFSRTLDKASWTNTAVEKDLIGGVKKLKSTPGPDMVILGSGSIVAQLAQEKLIDSFQLVINPLALGGGKTLFGGVKDNVGLKLTQTRQFKNGNLVLWYEPGA